MITSISSARGKGRPFRSVIVLGLVSVMTLAACGSGGSSETAEVGPPVAVDQAEWDKVVAAAKEEGSVVFAESLAGIEPVIAAFEAEYPEIDVTVQFAATGDLTERLDQEIEVNAPGADVAFHANPAWFGDHFENDDFAVLKVSPDRVEEGWEDLLEDKSHATVFGFPYNFGYRTTVTDKVPSTVKEFLDQNPDAKIGLVDPTASTATANVYETLRLEYGDEILDQLAETKYTIEPANSPLGQSLAAGSIDYAYPNQASTVEALIASGAPIGQQVTTEAVAGAYYNAAILSNAENPNAAQVFVNWLMSKAGATSFVEHISPATVPLKVEGAIEWGTVSGPDPKVWTTEKWNEWIEKYWTPRFS